MLAHRLGCLRLGLAVLVVPFLAAPVLAASEATSPASASSATGSNAESRVSPVPTLSPPDRIPSSIPALSPPSSVAGPSISLPAPADLGIAPPEPVHHTDTPSPAPEPAKSPPAAASLPDSSPPPTPKLNPIPDPVASGAADVQPAPPSSEHHKVETASFNHVTPGVTTEQEVQKAWGSPKQMTWVNGNKVHLYAVDPFDQVEVTFAGDQVGAIVVRLNTAVPADALAKPLNLAPIRPVLISNEVGDILGQTFPERGVLFSFEPSDQPGKASMRVTQIVLEPVCAESFVLRAETYLDTQLESSVWDLENAVKLDPKNARAHWLQARVLAILGDNDPALAAVDRALQLVPNDAQYQVTRAQILGQMGRFREGIDQAQAALPQCEKRAHVQARALCLLGDLVGSGPSPDYQRALEYHTQSITTADPLAVNQHPAVRRAAKEVLVDAHLGAAHDIAWGNWNEKEASMARWLDRATTFADDLVAHEGGTEEYRFRVASRALAACVGLQGKQDPTSWTEQVVRTGQQLINSSNDATRRQQIEWDLGLALYDAVQIYQMRSQHDQAIRYGEQAVACFEHGAARHSNLADLYLVGRLYFRLGAIRAAAEQDHRAAIAWFDKAIPVFEKSAAQVAPQEAGRLGETFVSMGVSYWESGQRDRAVRLTERGSSLIEGAVKQGMLKETSLEVPYSNLATMYRQLGQTQQADKILEQAMRTRSGSSLR